MHNHAPKSYKCPICLGVEGIESKETLLKQKDLIYKDKLVSAFINSFFIGKNAGHVIVVPNKHFENIYELPSEYSHRIADVAQKIAIAMKEAYKCDGITTRQNNEPAGDQHAFHYHFHIFPRYKNDGYNKNCAEKRLAPPEERLKYAKRMGNALKKVVRLKR